MKCTLLLTCACLCQCVYSQRIYINNFIGVSNYQGDLQSKIFEAQQAKPAVSLGVAYELSDKIMIRSHFTLAAVTADDKKTINRSRNLNFTSKIYEGQVAAEYYLRNLDEYYITPYFLLGVAVYHFNPTTKDSAGVKNYLAPLSTEGQGFYGNRQPYSLFQISIPFGGGIKYVIKENITIGMEMGIRKLFTDYLDDVSTTFIDKNLLQSKRGAKAVELAYRSNEINRNAVYPAEGAQRGSPAFKDWYYFFGITASFKIYENHRQKLPYRY